MSTPATSTAGCAVARVRDSDWRRAAAQDMTTLSYLNEPGVLWNLRCRYVLDAIYTYTGSILIAVNPFARLPHLYGAHMMEQYRGRDLGELSPHVYAIADAAYRQMRKEMRSQSILVRGSARRQCACEPRALGAARRSPAKCAGGSPLRVALRPRATAGAATGRRAAGERRERRRQDGDGEADHAVPGLDGQRGRAGGGAQRGAAGAPAQALLPYAGSVPRSAGGLPDQALRWRQRAGAGTAKRMVRARAALGAPLRRGAAGAGERAAQRRARSRAGRLGLSCGEGWRGGRAVEQAGQGPGWVGAAQEAAGLRQAGAWGWNLGRPGGGQLLGCWQRAGLAAGSTATGAETAPRQLRRHGG